MVWDLKCEVCFEQSMWKHCFTSGVFWVKAHHIPTYPINCITPKSHFSHPANLYIPGLFKVSNPDRPGYILLDIFIDKALFSMFIRRLDYWHMYKEFWLRSFIALWACLDRREYTTGLVLTLSLQVYSLYIETPSPKETPLTGRLEDWGFKGSLTSVIFQGDVNSSHTQLQHLSLTTDSWLELDARMPQEMRLC